MVRHTTAITTGVTHIGTMNSTQKKRPAFTYFQSSNASANPIAYSRSTQKNTIV